MTRFLLFHQTQDTTAEHAVLTVAGREVAISNPRKVLFPQAGYTKLDLARYYLAVADGALRGRRRTAQRARPLSERHRRRVLLSEARAVVAAGVDRRGRAAVSVRPQRGGSGAARAGGARRGWPISPASSCTRIRSAPTTSTIPTSCASISIRCPASPGRRSATSRTWSTRRWTSSGSSAGRRRRARAACTSTCASSGAGRSTRCAAPRSRWRARSSGARPAWRRASGGRRSATACSSTTTRTRRTGRLPARTRCGPRPTRACRRR